MPHPDAPVMIDQARTRAALGFPRLIAALREAFVAGAEVPLRHRHAVAGGGWDLVVDAFVAGDDDDGGQAGDGVSSSAQTCTRQTIFQRLISSFKFR